MAQGEERGAARPTVYLLVEIKVRELRARVLLARALADRGLRVHLGSRSAVADAIRTRPRSAGVYHFKGGEPLDAFLEARRHCEFVVGQDEEIGPALSPADVERAWRSRYSDDIVSTIDQLFAFSSSHVDILRRVRPSLAERSLVTGWPRVDVWRPGMRGPDERRAAAICSELGDFVLFASNFKINSEAQRDHAIGFSRSLREQLPPDQRGDRPEADDFGSRATHRLASFQRAATFLRDLAASGSGLIVIRPHPSESPQAWRDAIGDVPNLMVIADGGPGPWLMAARGVLHAGCTTAVEAAFAGVACGYLSMVGYQDATFEDTASWQVSHDLTDLDATRAFVDAALDGSLSTRTLDLPEDVFGPQAGVASNRIADAIAALPTTPEPPLPARRGVAAQRQIARVAAWGKDRLPGARFTGTNAQRKVPGGIHAPEVRAILGDLDGRSADDYSVSEPRFDLVAIEARGRA